MPPGAGSGNFAAGLWIGTQFLVIKVDRLSEGVITVCGITQGLCSTELGLDFAVQIGFDATQVSRRCRAQQQEGEA